MVRANQALFERGLTPPWVWDAEQCRSFWAAQDEATGKGNAPSAYAGKPQAIVDTLHDFWRPEVEPGMSILETGNGCSRPQRGCFAKKGSMELRSPTS